MISEEQLQEELNKLDDTRYYGYNWCHQYGWLIREYIKLNKEAEWLAWKITDVGGCRHCCSDCGIMTDPIKCFREAAKKAVESSDVS